MEDSDNLLNQAFTFQGYFEEIPDFRISRKKLYPLIEILVIALCGIICNAEAWTEVANFGRSREEWFKTFLKLENGIPSHDTFNRVFNLMDPKVFGKCFLNWMKNELKLSEEEVIAIDGKTLRGSYNNEDGKAAIHMISAMASESGLVLGQIKTAEKSNEITAIPRLLNTLDIESCTVTIDAMGCQKEIAKKIREKKADYVLALKGNQGNLHKDVELFLTDAKAKKFKEIPHDFKETIEKNRGRLETRRYWICDQVGWLSDLGHKDWVGLNSIGIVESIRTIKDKTTTELRYYISSLPADAERFAHAVRSHWSIENKLHWILDVVFREDDCRCRKDHGAENFAILRHIALNLLKKETTYIKKSMKSRQKWASWNPDYLKHILCC